MTRKSALFVQKNLEFPSGVLRVKKELQAKGDKFFDTLRMLTETKYRPLLNDLKEMWLSLQQAEIEKYGPARMATDDAWVRHFIACAAAYSDFPPYYYQKEADRKTLVEDLKEHSAILIRKLKSNGFDYSLGYSERQKLLSFYPDLDSIDCREADKHKTSSPRISELLSRLVKKAEKQISRAKSGKHDKHLRGRLFISGMTHHLEGSYENEMKDVDLRKILRTATAAIHKLSYDDDSIRKMQEREKKERKKSDKDDDNFSFLSVE